MNKPYLTKTDIVSYLRCPKKLWLSINNADACVDDPDNAAIVNGNLAGIAAYDEYPDGVTVEWETWEAAVEETKRLMADKSVKTIYEATFFADGVLVRADIMTRQPDGSWTLIEVKSATKLTNFHYEDAAIQVYIIKCAGIELSNILIMHITKDFVYNGSYDGLFTHECVFKKCDELHDNIMQAIGQAHQLVDNPEEPSVEMNPKCKRNHVCENKKYCEGLAPADHISYLPRGGTVQKKIAVNGFTRISEIPDGLLTSKNHIKVHDITMTGKELYTDGAKAKIDAASYPYHFLDFESIQFSVPRWEGVKVWRQIPFQFSNHIYDENGLVEHKSFLDITGRDPRRAFAEKLIDAVPSDGGTVFVYNKAFEQMIMRDLAADFADLANDLMNISERCLDLLPIMKDHYYSPEMYGSWSIKKVLTCFVPEMSYDSLDEVANGLQAQEAYLNLVNPDWEGDKDKLYHNALEYCKYDTLSMVKLVENINKRES